MNYVSRLDKQKRQLQQISFIIKPAVNEFKNSFFHYLNYEVLDLYVDIKILFIFDAYFKKKLAKNKQVLYMHSF